MKQIVISFHIAIGKIFRTIAGLNVRIGKYLLIQKLFKIQKSFEFFIFLTIISLIMDLKISFWGH